MMKRSNLFLTVALAALVGGCATLRPERPAEMNAAARLDRGLEALRASAWTDAFDELRWVYVQCAGYVRGSQALVALAALELDPRNPRARPAVGAELMARAIRDPGTAHWARPALETSYLMALSLGAPAPADTLPGPAQATPDARADTARADTARADTARTDTARADAEPATVPQPAAVQRPAEVPGPFGTRPPEDAPQPYGCGDEVVAAETVLALPTLPGPPLTALLSQMEAARDSAAARNARLSTELLELRARLAETEQELERIRRTLRP